MIVSTLKSFAESIVGRDPLALWLAVFLLAGFVAGIVSGYFRARKIQPGGFCWKLFRREIFFAAITLTFSAFVLGSLTTFLNKSGFVTVKTGPASPLTIGFEFALYFFGFDTWFYWNHRLMHIEPVYTWIHKIHHGSISPNPLTSLSESPIEAVINGLWVPLFTVLVPVHTVTMAFLVPTSVVMGLYVHSGFEFFPRWWNASWITKWFITATFHDQHHRYFKGNYGGYTTIWDRLCGTMRPTFEADFRKIASRPIIPLLTRASGTVPPTDHR
jgi:sterol desaturase/sphingolipid hydroxylase (fatty acid hydroxylase superfamily)